MRLRRKIVTAAVSVACGLALAACGQQVVAHISAADSVHSALGGVFSSPTTRFVVTAENLPGTASLADGSFSVVMTTSKKPAGESALVGAPSEISVYHQSLDLADIAEVDGDLYLRVDVKDIAAFTGPSAYSEISSEFTKLAARPGLSFLSDLLAGKWVGISHATLLEVETKSIDKDIAAETHMMSEFPALKKALAAPLAELKSAQALIENPSEILKLRQEASSSFMQSFQTWLSVQQKAADEYSLALPLRSFTGDLVGRLIKPVESVLQLPKISKGEITQALDKIPAGLSVKANVWLSNGSLTKIQAFVPTTGAYLEIAVSHPATPVTVPSGATMVPASSLMALSVGLLGAGLQSGMQKVSSVAAVRMLPATSVSGSSAASALS